MLKGGKLQWLTSSYRQMNLLPSLWKVTEKKFSCAHQLRHLIENITDKIYWKPQSAMLHLDMRHAFDQVWRDVKVEKVVRLCFPGYLIKVVQSFLWLLISGQCRKGALWDSTNHGSSFHALPSFSASFVRASSAFLGLWLLPAPMILNSSIRMESYHA